MPLGINNPLVRRVKRHASMSVLFRAAEPSGVRPVSSRHPPYVPPIISPRGVTEGIEIESTIEELSPLDQALQAAEVPPSELQPSVSQEARPSPTPEPAQKVQPSAPTPAIQQQPEQPHAQQPAPVHPSKEDQDWDGAWGRLRNIFQRQQERMAREEAAEESKPAGPPEAETERSKSIPDVQRKPGEPPVTGAVKRPRSTVEYITPEGKAKPIATPQPGSPETTSPQASEVTELASPSEAIQESPLIAETQTESQSIGAPEPSEQAKPAAQTPPPSAGREEKTLPVTGQSQLASDELEKDKISEAFAPAEQPESEPPVEKAASTPAKAPETTPAVQRAEAPAESPEQIARPADSSPHPELEPPETGIEAAVEMDSENQPEIQPEIQPVIQPEIQTESQAEPSVPAEKDEGLGQRILGAARRLLRSEADSQEPESPKERYQPAEQAFKSPEPIQRTPDTRPASPEPVEISQELPDTENQLEFRDERAAAIEGAEQPSKQELSPAIPTPSSEGSSDADQVVPETTETVMPAEGLRRGPSVVSPEEISELVESKPVIPEKTIVEQSPSVQMAQDTSADPGPVVQALPATGEVDIRREDHVQSSPETSPEQAEVTPRLEGGLPAESPVPATEISPVAQSTDEEETVILPAPDLKVEQEIKAVPLEEVWPVHRVEPDDELTPAPSPDAVEQIDRPVVQRRTVGGDESAERVDQALSQVQPGMQSDSAVELVTPRRPRPQIARKPSQELPLPPMEQPPVESMTPMEATDQPVTPAPESEPTAEASSFQRSSEEGEEGEDLPAPSAESRRAPPAGETMVPTEIGDLPSDFWEILGQKPPKATQPATVSKPTNGSLQRSPASPGEVAAAISHAEAPTHERPPLETFIQREWSAPVVQRADQTELTSSQSETGGEKSAETSTKTQESAKAPGGEVDVQKLAEAVYRQLKRRLAIERERGRGRF